MIAPMIHCLPLIGSSNVSSLASERDPIALEPKHLPDPMFADLLLIVSVAIIPSPPCPCSEFLQQ